jgi:hypothetical protein
MFVFGKRREQRTQQEYEQVLARQQQRNLTPTETGHGGGFVTSQGVIFQRLTLPAQHI